MTMKTCCSSLFFFLVDEDESAETDRKVQRREDVEPPCVRFAMNKNSDPECRVTPCLRGPGGNKYHNQHDQRKKERLMCERKEVKR